MKRRNNLPATATTIEIERWTDEPSSAARAGAGRKARCQPARPGLPARRHIAGRGQGRRGRARADTNLRRCLHRPQECRRELEFYIAEDLLRRGGGAYLSPLFAPHHLDPGGATRGGPAGKALLPTRPDRQGGTDNRASPRQRAARRRTCSRQRTAQNRTGHRDGRRDRRNQPIGVNAPMTPPRTLFDKIWDDHVIAPQGEGTFLIYIDLHFIHEVTTPQAFEGLKLAGRKVRRPDATMAVADHNIPTTNRAAGAAGIGNPESKLQVDVLERNVREFGVPYFPITSLDQGIVHIIGPEQGLSQPGMTIVCGDSHTATHGAMGALAFGIGTSEVEHVLATQTLIQAPAKNMLIEVNGALGAGVSPKDVILAIIAKIGTAGGTGHVFEYAGSTFRGMSMEGRMTVCNMSIEAGARAGLVAPDDKTIAYVMGRPYAPKGAAWEQAVSYWRTLPSDPGAKYDKEAHLDAADIAPHVTWGTSPQDVAPITGRVPDPAQLDDPLRRAAMLRSLEYMALAPNTKLVDVPVQRVFIGSCTNSRIEDLRAAAAIARSRKVAEGVTALVVPGSGHVKHQAEEEGLDRIFLEAGFQWRDAGCSMCMSMNDDKAMNGERIASTSNRNFEGRQGKNAKTHLIGPAMAAAAAVTGRLTDVRQLG